VADINIANMQATIGFKTDKTQLNSAMASVEKMNNSFLSIKSAILGTVVAGFMWEAHLGKVGTQLANTAMLLQIPTDKLQAFKLAADEAGVPVSSLTSALQMFQNAVVAMKSGGAFPENIGKGLAMLSAKGGGQINVGGLKDSGDFLRKFADHIKLVKSIQDKEAVFNALGLNPDLIPLIGNGMDKIDKTYASLKSRGSILSDSQIKEMQAFHKSMVDAMQQFSFISDRIGTDLMPGFKAMIDLFMKASNDKKFISGLKEIEKVLTDIIYLFIKLVDFMGYIGEKSNPQKGDQSILNTGAVALNKGASFLHDPFNYASTILKNLGQNFNYASAYARSENQGLLGGSFLENKSSQNNINKNTSTTTNNSPTQINNHTTIINTHSNIGLASAHVTGRYR
jgi:hypothetical protein